MEPEEEPGGAAVREVYEEVTKPKQTKNPADLCCCYLQMGTKKEEGTTPFIQYLTETFVVSYEIQRTAVLCVRIGV